MKNLFNTGSFKFNFKYETLLIIIALLIVWVYFFNGGSENGFLMLAAILGIGMAITIGANDVANNMGPAVGSKALTITGAIIIAGVFEASGVMIAGGDVVNTIKKGIIDPSLIKDQMIFIYIMLATLAGASIWVAIATIFKAPVSTTHSIIGGLIGAGVTAIGIDIVSWGKVGQIAASWLISPVMGGIIATILFLSIRKNILKQEDRGESAKIWLPVYIGLMIWAFVTYLLMKGFKPILKELDKNVSGYDLGPALLDPSISLFIGFIMSILVFSYFRLYYKSQNSFFKNSKKFINKLFNFPLIFAVALLSFAHGANDVANAIGPLAAINSVIHGGAIGGKAGIAMWVMLIGAIGLVLGLSVFGSRLIKTVGSEITKLNQVRAYCVALAAAITVILASGLGLPVSSTHIALGGIFGIGLTREVIKRLKGKHKIYIKKSMITRIALAWIITLPASGVIASITFLTIKALN